LSVLSEVGAGSREDNAINRKFQSVALCDGTPARRARFSCMRLFSLLTAVCVIAGSTLAFAQAPPSPSTPGQSTAPENIARPKNNCSPTEAVPEDSTIAPKGTTTGQGAGPQLTDRLAQSGGVLCPPSDVDPQMRAPTPEGGNTPVIPPPGTRDSDSSMRPK